MLTLFISQVLFICVPFSTLPNVPERAMAGLPILITHGKTIRKIADLPEKKRAEAAKLAGGNDLKVGFLYRYFGVFWIDLWTWDGQYCLFHENQVHLLTPNDCADLLGTTQEKLSKPWQYRFPLGLILISGVAAIFVPLNIMASVRMRREQERINQLFEDTRYQYAIDVFHRVLSHRPAIQDRTESDLVEQQQNLQTLYQEAIDSAVEYLVQNGEDRSQASMNLATMLAILEQSSSTQAVDGTESRTGE